MVCFVEEDVGNDGERISCCCRMEEDDGRGKPKLRNEGRGG